MSGFIDKVAAQEQWKERFNNRTPLPRVSAKVRVEAAAASDTAEIMLYDEIGFWGITANDFISSLNAISAPKLTVRINSPGGDVFDGLAIYNALKEYPGEVTTKIEGLAASAASFIALAGKRCLMAENSLLMCHRAWGMSIGNSSDMLETATILEKIDNQLAGIYAAKSGKLAADCMAMMAGEGKNDGTWFDAAEAKAWGLVDETEPVAEPVPSASFEHQIKAMKRRLAIADRDD